MYINFRLSWATPQEPAEYQPDWANHRAPPGLYETLGSCDGG